jgi:hypothetical protein
MTHLLVECCEEFREKDGFALAWKKVKKKTRFTPVIESLRESNSALIIFMYILFPFKISLTFYLEFKFLEKKK